MNRKIKRIMPVRVLHARYRPGVALVLLVLLTIASISTPASEASAGETQGDPVQVVGRWMRTDGGYILQLSSPTFDGRLAAAYFNPRPINVSRSGWVLEEGNLLVLVELRDQGYPGSTYTLAYQQDSDRLVGIYFQAAAQQKFEVVFERIE